MLCRGHEHIVGGVFDVCLIFGLLWLASPLRAEVFLRANQVGFAEHDLKVAVALSGSALPDTFSVIDVHTGASVFDGKTLPLAGERWGKFDQLADLDFTTVSKQGRYVLRLGDTRSLPFAIGQQSLADLPDEMLEFLRQQRCGYNPWLRARCHQNDGRTAYGPLPAGTQIDARGGWHDAADLLKYHLTSGNATAQMLLAYELTRHAAPRIRALPTASMHRVTPARMAGPISLTRHAGVSNGCSSCTPRPTSFTTRLPTTAIMLASAFPRMISRTTAGGREAHVSSIYADGRPQGLRQFQSESTGVANIAGRYAAAMALACQTWKNDPREHDFAERCLKAGREVYEQGREREGSQQGNSYKAPYRYEETTWADDMEWGAAELFRVTGEHRYLEDAKRYARTAASDTWMGREQTKHYQFYPFMNVGHFRLHGLVDPTFQKILIDYYRDGIAGCVRAAESTPYRVGVPFIWCSNNLVVALVTQCAFYERMTGDARFRGVAIRNRDWLLGRNPWGYTMFTGVGTVYPQNVHLQTTKLTGRLVRGGLVDGPVYQRIFRSQLGVSITEPDPLAPFQDQRAVYHDDINDYVSNEPTMDGSASAILMFVALVELRLNVVSPH